jgi:flagellar biosynthetic protein FliR
MLGELLAGGPLLLGFLLTLARIGGIFTFVPLPGLRSGFDTARLLLSLSVTLALAPGWPRPEAARLSPIFLLSMAAQEVLLGLAVGLLVGFVAEGFLLAFQIPALQAGYTYASTVDPNSSADSSVLQVTSQIACGLLFFALGLHREVLAAVAASLQGQPPGHVVVGSKVLDTVAELSRIMFHTALRLSLPVVSMLFMVDLILALMSRLNAQLQLIALMFPAKMLLSLAVFAGILTAVPPIYSSAMGAAIDSIRQILTP